MKRTFPLIAVGLVCLAALATCSKKSSGNASQGSCELVTVNIQNQATTSTINLTYNDQGQETGLQFVNPGQPTINDEYSYSGNEVYITQSIVGSPTSNDTVMLNSNGQVATESGIDPGGIGFLTNFTYSGDELVKYVNQDAMGNVKGSSFFSWSGGNMVREIDVLSGGTDTITFTYNNNPAQAGDYWDLYNLETYPVKLFKTANMVSGITTQGMPESIAYSTDSTGKVSGFTLKYGQTTESYSYQWSCH